MYFDSHIHTEFSADSEMKAQDALREAERQGLGLVFTEHLDYDYPSAGTEEFIFDPAAYWAAYEPLRAKGNLSLGVEMGMMASAREKNAAFLQRVPFDFVLASIHFLDVKDLYYPETFEGREKAEMYHEYFTVMCDEIYAHPFINALAHIDYIARNSTFDNPEISYGEFTDEIDAVLRYYELGGRYVTIGSDAHIPEGVGRNYARARELARAFDLTVVTFRERQMRICE